jgi:hypothetical protein
MKIAAAVGFSAWLVSGGMALGLPSLSDRRIVETDGTILMTEDGDDSPDALWEWKRDGAIEKQVAPFGPFTVRDPRGFGEGLTPVKILGEAGVIADGSILYKRGADGLWHPGPLFQDKGGPLPCPAGATCIYGQTGVDDGGTLYHFLVTLDLQIVTVVEENGQLREANAVEKQLTFATMSGDDVQFLKEPGTGKLLVPQQFGSQSFSYDVITADGVEAKALELGAPFMFILGNKFMKHGNELLVAVTTFEMPTPGDAGVKMHYGRVHDPYGAATYEEILSLKSGFASGAFFGTDDQFGYAVAAPSSIVAIALGDGTQHEVATCTYPTVVAAGGDYAGQNAYAVCGAELLTLHHGEIVGRTPVPSTLGLSSGFVVADGGEPAVLLQGSSVNVRVQGGQVSYMRPSLDVPSAAATPSWQENGHLCGMVSDGTTKTVQCREGTTWTPAAGHPLLSEVMRYSSGLWAYGKSGTHYTVYHLTPVDGVEAWVEVGAVDMADPSVPEGGTAPLPHFVASGGDRSRVAIDAPTRDYLVSVQDGKLVKTHAAARVDTTGALFPVRSVLDADGALYSRCGAFYCVIGADGSIAYGLEVGTNPVGAGQLLPLKRGALVWNGNESLVLRGTRAIRLDALYGELHTQPEWTVRLTGEALFGKGELIKATDPNSSRYYLYDGVTLSEYGEREVAGAGVTTGGDGLKAASASSGSVSGISFEYAQPSFVHADERGLFQRGEGLGEKRAHELAIAFGGVGQALNRTYGVARSGDWLLLGTDAGVVACDAAAGEVMEGVTTFGRTQGCRIVRAEGPVRALVRAGDAVLALEGKAVSAVHGAVLSRGAATGLVRDGENAVWIEDGATAAVFAADGVERRALPAGMTSAVSARYACGDKGLAFWDGAAWQAVAGVAACAGLTGNGEDAFVLTHGGTASVHGGVAGAVTALPAPAHDDVVVGRYAGEFAVAIGTRIFSADGRNVTPQWSGVAAVKTRALVLGDDGVGLDGGGAIAGGRFFRLE